MSSNQRNKIDDFIICDLIESLNLVLKPSQDEGGFQLEPDHDAIFGLIETIKFYMPYQAIEKFMEDLIQRHDYFKKYEIELLIKEK